MNLRETYNKIAEAWHKDHQKDDWWKAGTDKFISFLKPGSSVLDVGCGGGTKAKYLLSKGLVVSGIDFSENLVAIARREVPGATFTVLDLNNLDTMPGEYDGVFVQAVLLHFPKKDIPAITEKLVRKIKNGGYLYVAVKERDTGEPEEVTVKENDYGYPYERFFSYFSLQEMQSYIQQSGLSIVNSESTPSGNTHWIQIVAKKSTPSNLV